MSVGCVCMSVSPPPQLFWVPQEPAFLSSTTGAVIPALVLSHCFSATWMIFIGVSH